MFSRFYFSIFGTHSRINTAHDTYESSLDVLLADGVKKAVITDTNHVSSLAKLSNGTFKYKIMKEKIISDHLSFIMVDPNNFLRKTFNHKMQQLVEAGIAKKIVNDATKTFKLVGAEGPEILTLNHLEVWFIIWLYGLLVALLVFVVEFSFRNKEKFMKIILKN